MVLKDPALFSLAEVAPEQFSSQLLGKAFRLLKDRHDRNLGVQLPPLAGDFTAEEMSHLVEATEQPESLAYACRAMKDYIETIQSEYRKRQEPTGSDVLLELRKKKREKTTMEDGA